MAPAAGGPADKTFGLGVYLGLPTGISGKFWANEMTAFDLTLSYSVPDEELEIFADYHLHFRDLINSAKPIGDVSPYVGVGPALGFRKTREGRNKEKDNPIFNVRFPLGVSVLYLKYPFDVFIEVAPGMSLLPETAVQLEAGIGGRIYF